MLIVCSVFDNVKKKSVFITMNENIEDAVREFTRSMSHPQLKDVKNDLVLYHIGEFDERTLDIVRCDKVFLKAGDAVETSDFTPSNFYTDVGQKKEGAHVETIE